VSVNVCPPIVSVPIRGDGVVFAVATNSMVASPLPFVALVIVSQLLLLLTAVQEQLLAVSTAVELVPPPAIIVWLVGTSV
jgi:hypothetical protein